MTVQDGDTIAIGGAIMEHHGQSTAGIPLLDRIPGLGFLFGAKSYNSSRTELIIFLTPRVIYDTNQMVEASDEIKSNLKLVQKVDEERMTAGYERSPGFRWSRSSALRPRFANCT